MIEFALSSSYYIRMYQTYSLLSETTRTPERVARLRARLSELSIDGFLVPHSDEFQNEYLPACNERLSWLTGFTGSAGLAIVLAEKGAVFIDGRYTLQVQNQVDLSLFETHQIPQAKPDEWLAKHLKGDERIGFDPRLHTISSLQRWQTTLAKAHPNCQLIALEDNPLDDIWEDRPPQPRESVSLHPLEYAGIATSDKLHSLQKELHDEKLDAFLLTDPASIAWLFNIRGRDVPHTPLALSYAILHRHKKPELLIDPAKLSEPVEKHLATDIDIFPIDELEDRLLALTETNTRLGLDPAGTPYWFQQKVSARTEIEIVKKTNPCTLPKAIKNEQEIAGMRAAHIRDSVAVTRFLVWLDETGIEHLDEITAAKKLESLRQETGALRDISFETISGSGSNGAIVHYRVDEASNKPFAQNSLYLFDSGGQYLDGTTDITRTIAIGAPSEDMRRHYTLVLKGHVALAASRFPSGTRGVDLDVLARIALWKAGLDYDHGTGHGVGSYLGVHEGPQNISKRGMTELKPGMIISNEPGFYKQDHYGIRIENLVLVTPALVPKEGERPMLGFETLTLVPFARALIDLALLDNEEIDWIDHYHKRVHDAVHSSLTSAIERDWLLMATAPLNINRAQSGTTT